ncbi:MAG: hypothetical protein HY599_02805, partial [Candidatus Omnitrophica bacterium]|nr:hypothetical protein [Candidatus Omnitrophota bacterium]
APGGWFVAFDYFHPFEQRVALTETSRLHPDGLTFYLRPYGVMQRLVEEAGFESPAFRPFHLPIDLPPPGDPSQITSYTVNRQDGGRLCFRGTLYQPWCHLTAQRRR